VIAADGIVITQLQTGPYNAPVQHLGLSQICISLASHSRLVSQTWAETGK
jgi:hypothetical protein